MDEMDMRFRIEDKHGTVAGLDEVPLDHAAITMLLAPERPLRALAVGEMTPARGLPAGATERYWVIRVA